MNNKFENYIAEQIDKAEKIARNYELAIRKGRFEEECPYLKIIKIYEVIAKKVIECGWNEQAVIFNKQIKFYYKKLEKDKKLRKIEAQKLQKQREFEDLHKIKEIDAIRGVLQSLDKEQKILNFEEKKKKSAEEAMQIFNMISKAEKIVREYEKEVKTRNILHIDSPYEKIIAIYEESKHRFESIGWKEESIKIDEAIKFYKEKVETDKKLRKNQIKKQSKE
ncbi:MAG: hypothetical protein ACFFEY_11625 [Candidatus Thorarchaeota archaeon]